MSTTSYFDDFTKVPSTLLRILQLDVEQAVNLNLKQKVKRIAKKIYYLTFAFFLIFNMTLSARALMFSEPIEMQKIVLGINLLVSTTAVVTKIIMLFMTSSNFMEIAGDLKRNYSADEIKKYGIDKYTKSIRRFNKVYLFFWLVPLIIQFQSVLIVLILTGEKTLPLFIEYPEFLHPKSDSIFPFVFMFTIWSCLSPTFAMVTFDLAFYNLITALSMEFDILTRDAKDLKDVEKSKLFNELQKIVNRQNRLFEISSKLERMFTFSNFYCFFTSSIIICFAAFVSSLATNITEVIPFGSYCISTIYQLYLQCLFGQKLMDASSGVLLGIYDCGWEKIEDIELKKQFILIMMRSRKAAKVTLMGLGDISMQQFTNAMMRAYSYFAVCNSIYSGESSLNRSIFH